MNLKLNTILAASLLVAASASGQTNATPILRGRLMSNLNGNGYSATNFGTVRATNFVDAATGLPFTSGGGTNASPAGLYATNTGTAGQFYTWGTGATGYWSTAAGSGDMLASVYDTNANGIVDVAENGGSGITNQFTTNVVGAAVLGNLRFIAAGSSTNSLTLQNTYSSIASPSGIAEVNLDGDTITLTGTVVGGVTTNGFIVAAQATNIANVAAQNATNGLASGSQTNIAVAGVTNAGTAAYSNAAAFYPTANPSNYITSAGVPSSDPWLQPYKIGQINNRNQYAAWPRLSSTIAGSGSQTVPFQIFGWGESGHFSGLYDALMQRIWRVVPCAGIIGGFGNYQAYQFNGGYFTNVSFGYGYVRPVYLPASATLHYTNLTTSILDSFGSRVLEICFLKTNIGGVFTPYVSTAGGAWTAMTMPYSGATTVGTSTNGYGSQTIRWTNSSWSRPQQLMVSNSSASPVIIFSLGQFTYDNGGVVAIPYMTTGSPHWQGFFDGYVGDGSDATDRTNVIRPMWSNWFATFPTLSIYDEFVQHTNWTYYLPKFYNYLKYVNGGTMERTDPATEWVFMGPLPDTGEDDTAQAGTYDWAGAETNVISSSIELHDFVQTNRLVSASGLSTNWPWRAGFFDLCGVYGVTGTNAWWSGLITNVFDLAPTAAGAQNAANALYSYLGGDSLFAGRYNKQLVSPSLPAGNSSPSGALQVNGGISTFGTAGGLEIVRKDLVSSFYLKTPPSGASLNIFAGSTDIFSYTNRGGGYEFFRFAGAVSPDPINGFYFINTNNMDKIPTFASALQNSATYRGQGILANDNGVPVVISSGPNGTTWLRTNRLDAVYASNIVSGGVLPSVTVAANTMVAGALLGTDGTSRYWTNDASGLTNLPVTAIQLGATNQVLISSGTNNSFSGNVAVSNLTVVGNVVGNVIVRGGVTATNGVFGSYAVANLSTNVVVATGTNTVTGYNYILNSTAFTSSGTGYFTNLTAGAYRIQFGGSLLGSSGSDVVSLAIYTNNVQFSGIQLVATMPASGAVAETGYKSTVIVLPANCPISLSAGNDTTSETVTINNVVFDIGGAN